MTKALQPGTTRSIALKDLKPHPLAQRRYDDAWSKEIAENFDPAKFGEPVVAETKRSRLFVVDGQHRVAAALLFLGGDTTQQIQCRVIPVDSDAEAADLFLGLNNHKVVKVLDKFFVRIVAKDETALAIVAILERHGLSVGRDHHAGKIRAVDALEGTFNRDGGALLLDRVISILIRAWGNDPDAYSGSLVRGLALLLSRYNGQIDDEELVRKIAKRSGPLGVLGRARDLKAAIGGSIAQAVAEHIRGEYNKGRRTERLEEKAA